MVIRVLIATEISSCTGYLTFLKGQLHGRAEIFKGLKMTLRTKIWGKNTLVRTTLISIKNNTNFVLTTFRDAPRAQDNLSKYLTVLSATPSDGTLQNLCTFLVRV